MAGEKNLPDTLMIDNTQVVKGNKVAVKVNFVNDQELAALTIPIGIVGDWFLIDSVSFVGSRVEYLKMRPVTIAENHKDIVFGAICMTEDYIPVGKGLLATLYLSPTESAKSESCKIDTTTVGPASVLFTLKNSASFVPEFRAGTVSFKEAETKKPSDSETAEKKDE
jgi:hypothetical protein